ncbi:hypothetical protein Hanom_Chr01g00060301 [Helianthus anomalus]
MMKIALQRNIRRIILSMFLDGFLYESLLLVKVCRGNIIYIIEHVCNRRFFYPLCNLNHLCHLPNPSFK